jgi:hypothetical protein
MRALLIVMLSVACGGVGAFNPSITYDAGTDGIPGAAAHERDGGTDDLGGIAAGSVPLYQRCESNADCMSGLCNPYPGKGGDFCTNVCTTDNEATECPPPGQGCNKMGVCKF